MYVCEQKEAISSPPFNLKIQVLTATHCTKTRVYRLAENWNSGQRFAVSRHTKLSDSRMT